MAPQRPFAYLNTNRNHPNTVTIMFTRLFRRRAAFRRPPAITFTDRRIAGMWIAFFGK